MLHIDRNDKIISLNCIVTEAYRILYDNAFYPSVKDINIKINTYEPPFKGGRGGREWIQTATFKADKVIESIAQGKQNQIVIWSDIDLFFAKDPNTVCQEILKAMIGRDFVFSSERGGTTWINSGFFAARCNQAAFDFYMDIREKLVKNNQVLHSASYLGEQHIINRTPKKMKWGILPETFWNTTIDVPMPADVSVVHINYIPPSQDRSPKGKLKKINEFKRLLRLV